MTSAEIAQEKTKTVTIIVNTRPHKWAEDEDHIRAGGRAGIPGPAVRPGRDTTVEYSRGHGHDKSLRPGESVARQGRNDLRCRTRQSLLTIRSPICMPTAMTWCYRAGTLSFVASRTSADGPRDDGKLVLPVNDSGEAVVDAIGDHTIWFAGQEPRDERGVALGSPSSRDDRQRRASRLHAVV